MTLSSSNKENELLGKAVDSLLNDLMDVTNENIKGLDGNKKFLIVINASMYYLFNNVISFLKKTDSSRDQAEVLIEDVKEHFYKYIEAIRKSYQNN